MVDLHIHSPPSSAPPLIIAGSAAIAPTIPLHEARLREHQAQLKARSLEEGEGFELHELEHFLPSPIEDTHDPSFFTTDDNGHSFPTTTDEHGPSSSPSMPARKAPKATSSSLAAELPNGGSTSPSNGDMNGGAFHERRKHPSTVDIVDDDSADARDRLMGRDTFSLDQTLGDGSGEESSKGFWELPVQDRRNFLLLVLLYFLQGIPMGLAGGSVPFLLKSHLSYSQIGVYSLASYPYSLKLLWSPIVDAWWSAKVGRRKSWILPIQMLSGVGMLWLGAGAQQMMEKAGEDNGAGIWGFTGWWFALVFMCATQDIAVDGWALTLLSPSNLSYASTAQTVGLTAGQFLSYTVFLAFQSPDFANKYFRSTPQDVGLMTLNSYLTFWGWMYILVTLGLGILKKENFTKEKEGVWDVYKTMAGILKLRNIQTFIVIHLIAKIGFQANDAVTNLKLLDKGFSQEDLALTVLIDFPFEIMLGYYAGKWSEQYKPVRVWCWAFVGRLIAAMTAQLVVTFFPTSTGTTTSYLMIIILQHVYSTFTSTVMFVAISAFHAKISDPVIGGTYMTLLATVSNLGGTFPRFFVLKFVDIFTLATCHPALNPSKAILAELKGDLITQSFSCVQEVEKHVCLNGGGTCVIERDGYYIVNILCVVFGVVTFWGFIKPKAMGLQGLPMRAWRLSG